MLVYEVWCSKSQIDRSLWVGTDVVVSDHVLVRAGKFAYIGTMGR